MTTRWRHAAAPYRERARHRRPSAAGDKHSRPLLRSSIGAFDGRAPVAVRAAHVVRHTLAAVCRATSQVGSSRIGSRVYAQQRRAAAGVTRQELIAQRAHLDGLRLTARAGWSGVAPTTAASAGAAGSASGVQAARADPTGSATGAHSSTTTRCARICPTAGCANAARGSRRTTSRSP